MDKGGAGLHCECRKTIVWVNNGGGSEVSGVSMSVSDLEGV
jgi:hypothetical protein